MGNLDEEIMVVSRNILFNSYYFEGFEPHGDRDFEQRILENFQYMRRGDAEVNPAFKQPIAYIIIVNPITGKVFAYQRSSKDSSYSERRLQGKMSWGIGGHIERFDGATNPIEESLLRELDEEVIIKGPKEVKILGYINDDSNDVGKVHFGILYIVETDAEEVVPKAKEIEFGRLTPYQYLETLLDSQSEDVKIEDWSRIAFPALVEHLRRPL